jgi:homoserine O-succinyltransferase
MPKKVQTETQFARVIGATPLQIELTLIRMSDHEPKNTSAAHLEAFYQPFREARERRFDGLIITGAPIEHLDFEAVSYWNELREVFDWTQTNVHSTMGICWGGMAMLHHFHGVPKHMLPAKAFGCFRHRPIAPASALLQGFSDSFLVPVSRWTEVRFEDVELHPELKVLIHSEEVGPCLVEDRGHRAFYMFNHLEYDSTTLKEEYDRDLAAGDPVAAPLDYFPDDDPAQPPENRWRSHGQLLYGNWINEIYQSTPYELASLGA